MCLVVCVYACVRASVHVLCSIVIQQTLRLLNGQILRTKIKLDVVSYHGVDA